MICRKRNSSCKYFDLAYEGNEADEPLPGTKEAREVFGAKQLYKKRRDLIKLTDGTDFSLGFSCICLTGTLNLLHAQLLQLPLTSFTDCNADVLESS